MIPAAAAWVALKVRGVCRRDGGLFELCLILAEAWWAKCYLFDARIIEANPGFDGFDWLPAPCWVVAFAALSLTKAAGWRLGMVRVSYWSSVGSVAVWTCVTRNLLIASPGPTGIGVYAAFAACSLILATCFLTKEWPPISKEADRG